MLYYVHRIAYGLLTPLHICYWIHVLLLSIALSIDSSSINGGSDNYTVVALMEEVN